MTWIIERLGTVGSTNDEAMARAQDGAPHGTVVCADVQTRGRGRQGRTWRSLPGENIFLSVVLRLGLPPVATPPVTLAAGVATCEAVNHFAPGASIKWPNDVLWSGLKMAGILTEASTRGDRVEAVILGVGLNVNATELPPELHATSLRLASGRTLDRDAVLARLLAELERWTDALVSAGPAPVLAAWRERTSTFGRRLRAPAGVAVDIDESGALVVETEDGRRIKVHSGEWQSDDKEVSS
jgi:BirA family biotin operon repressor/biotin-[acetyl-CoA-carboxylase] ligase